MVLHTLFVKTPILTHVVETTEEFQLVRQEQTVTEDT